MINHCVVRFGVPAVVLALGCAAGGGGAAAQMSPEDRANLVLLLLPEAARSDASILLRDGEEELVYREGTGTFLCASDVSSPARISMVCHHRVLDERLKLERELSRESGLQGSAFRERLCREVASRGLEVPNGAMEITASLPQNDDGSYPAEMTVYHLLWLPDQNAATLGVTDEDPGEGRPWLHQAGSCGAHVMWSEEVLSDK